MEPGYIKLRDIKPALYGYIRDSEEMIGRAAIPDELVVHDIRVLMKKSRAALKLTASQLHKEYCDKDIEDLREVGRLMADWREQEVFRSTLKDLRKENRDLFKKLDDVGLISGLLKKPEISESENASINSKVEKIAVLLKKSSFRVRFQQMDTLDPHLLLKELENTYLTVSEIFLDCRIDPKPKKIHRFRKKAKELLYQLVFFRPMNPDGIKKVEKLLDRIAQNLGRYNDLSQLLKVLIIKDENTNKLPALDYLIIKIRDEQDLIMSKVWIEAYRIFSPGKRLEVVLGYKILVI